MMAKTVAVFSSPAQKGEIVSQQQVDDTTWQWQLGNGVEVWLKQMPDIKKKCVHELGSKRRQSTIGSCIVSSQ